MQTWFRTSTIDLALSSEEGPVHAVICYADEDPHKLEAHKDEFLHEKEDNYLQTLQFSRRRASYLIGRHAAKEAVSQLIGRKDRKSIWIHRGFMSQPLVYLEKHNLSPTPNPQVSITHSRTLGGALAFDEATPMALDIELIDHNHEKALLRYLSEKELGILSTLSLPKIDSMTMAWTIKEALSKCLRCGLSAPVEIWEINYMSTNGSSTTTTFRNFPGFKAISKIWGGYAVSIVIPQKLELTNKDAFALPHYCHTTPESTALV